MLPVILRLITDNVNHTNSTPDDITASNQTYIQAVAGDGEGDNLVIVARGRVKRLPLVIAYFLDH